MHVLYYFNLIRITIVKQPRTIVWMGHYIKTMWCNRLTTQQTRNHFWTSWHMSSRFIIDTTPPIRVFMCIHVNTCVLPVVTSFERVWHKSYWVRTGTVSLACVITWKTRDFTVNTCRHIKFVHRIRWIHVNWARWTLEFTSRTCEITGRCLLGIDVIFSNQKMTPHLITVGLHLLPLMLPPSCPVPSPPAVLMSLGVEEVYKWI